MLLTKVMMAQCIDMAKRTRIKRLTEFLQEQPHQPLKQSFAWEFHVFMAYYMSGLESVILSLSFCNRNRHRALLLLYHYMFTSQGCRQCSVNAMHTSSHEH